MSDTKNGFDPVTRIFNDSGVINYKDASRYYWQIRVTKNQRISRPEPGDENYYVTEWQVVVQKENTSSDTEFRTVFCDFVETQYDQPLRLEEIFQAWQAEVNAVCLGMIQHAK